ncbi:MAG: PDZ domain-containing protein [Alphaproteobacteria bacterium]|nr:PDZ domain-containing protein [Alphaproteobacteria bacterium]
MSRSTRRLKRRVKAVFQAVLAFTLTASAYLGPFVMAVLATKIPDIALFEKEEPAVRYMASMSLTPFPDPTAEVVELTEELLEPPPRMKPKEKPQEKQEERKAPEEASAPVDAQEGPGTPIKQGAQSKKDPVPQTSGERSGGKSFGPTQDGTGKKAQDCLPDNPDITKVDNYTYRVKRDLIDYYVNHLKKAETLATTLWVETKTGEITGFKVTKVRCGNDLYQLGFRPGDVVLEVNGAPVTSAKEAIAAYLELRNANVLKVRLRRRKQMYELTFRLV